MRKRLMAMVMLVVLGALAMGCSKQDNATSEAASTGGQAENSGAQSKADGLSGAAAPAVASDRAAGGGDAVVDLAQAPDVGVPALPDALPGSSKVIKNINLEVRIDKGEFQRAFSRASTIAEQFQGFVSASQVSKTEKGELSSGLLTIRVPSDKFEQAVARIKDLGEVTGEDRSGQDVTKEFVDLEARLKHAQTEEAFYVKLMGEAKTVGDMIQVQNQLSGVQLRIEEIQGQLQYLKDQTSYSTITANIYQPGAALLGEPKPLTKAWEDAVNGFQSVVSGVVVGLGYLAPFVLLGLIALGIVRLSRRPKVKPVKEPEPAA